MRDRQDSELVRAVLEGETEAFEPLVERYGGKLYNAALRVTGNADDALDAAQSALLKAYDNLARFDSSRRFFSWIYRIGINEALDLVGRRRHDAELPSEVPAPASVSPERAYRGREAGETIGAALLALTPDHRAVIVLRHFHELTYAEMGEVLGIPAKTVKSRLFSARRELRRALAGSGPERT